MKKLQHPLFLRKAPQIRLLFFQQKHDPEWKNRSGYSRIILDAFS